MAYRAHYACAYIQVWDPEALQAPQRVGLTPGYPVCGTARDTGSGQAARAPATALPLTTCFLTLAESSVKWDKDSVLQRVLPGEGS